MHICSFHPAQLFIHFNWKTHLFNSALFKHFEAFAMFHRQSATVLPVASPTIAEQPQVPAVFSCFLCKSLFDDPLLLSCGHSFCRRCVEPWLRQSTNCPHCRFTTLAPIRNTTMAEKVDAFKRRNGKSQNSNFIRSFVRRSMHPSKEARVLQREAVRASQRRPKNVVLPEKSSNSPNVREMAATLEEKLELSGRSGNASLNGKEAFPRMGNLRRSFARIRHKMAGKQIQEEEKLRSNSVSGLLPPSNHPPPPNATIGQLLYRNHNHHNLNCGIPFRSPGTYSQHSAISGQFRPSMGLSGSALRRFPTNNTEEIKPKETKLGKVVNESGSNSEKGVGCVIM